MTGTPVHIAIAVFAAATAAISSSRAADATNVLPHEWIGDIDRSSFREPSDVCFHAGRGTLFVVGDEGDLCEMRTDGSVVKSQRVRRGDFEGVTCDPSSGLLYVAVEGEECVLEVHPDTFEVLRTFQIPRDFHGQTLMREGGQGIEGITFVPDPKQPQGGTFFVANQCMSLDISDDISGIFVVELPLKDGGAPASAVKILRYFEPGVPDIAGLYYDAAKDTIFMVSDKTDTLLEFSRDGRRLAEWQFPGKDQEGIAADPEGFLYIAQDCGGIIKIRWRGLTPSR
jgi:uncharacterized protein YjiK